MEVLPQRSPGRGYIIALGATVAWSSSGIFIAYLTGHFRVPPLALAFWRNLLVTAALLGVLSPTAPQLLRTDRRHLPTFIVYGLILAVLNGLFPLSVALNGAAVATLLIHCAPVFSALAARAFLGESLGLMKIGAVTTGLAGCVLVSGGYDPTRWKVNALSIAVGLGTGLAFAAYGLVGKTLARRGVPALTAMAYAFPLSTALLLLLQRGAAFSWLPQSALAGQAGGREAILGWGALVLLSLGPTLAGHGLYTASLAHLPASTATLINTLEPPLTGVMAYLLLGERLGTFQLAGGFLVLIGVFAVAISDRRQREREVAAPPRLSHGRESGE